MKRLDRVLAVLLILGAMITVVYWFNYFSVSDVRVLSDYWYSAFENSFPAADGWMALCMLIAGVGLWSGKRFGALFGLMAGSALIYLAAMDITFNVQHGLYNLLGRSGPMVVETAINFTSLILGIVTLAVSWKRSAHSDAAH